MNAPMLSPVDAAIAGRTDVYFNRTKEIVAKFGDCRVTYAVFLRRPVVSAPRLALEWLAAASEMGLQTLYNCFRGESSNSC